MAPGAVPLVLGGEPLPVRPGVLCSSCNARKGSSHPRRCVAPRGRRPTLPRGRWHRRSEEHRAWALRFVEAEPHW